MLTDEEEDRLEEYTIKIARMYYGLPARDFQKLVLRYAVACGSSSIPKGWHELGRATWDWYSAYMTRHPRLVLKAPEGMSIARAMAFNRINVEVFFKAYTEAMSRYNFSASRIFNLDESGFSTVMKPTKVICEKGLPVASQVARERGAHMTFVGIVNAAGNTIPPVFIIARKRMNPDFKRGAIDGSEFLLHHNGWMTHEGFLETLKHVHEKTFCTVDNKILLIMDNAECHMSIHAVEYAIRHGIVIVTLPPHTTAKLQPLDVSVFGPFKTCLRRVQEDYKLTHPNVAITEQMLPEMASQAWIRAATPSNILSGFAATGIWPINRDIFPDEAFAGAEVTEQEMAQAVEAEASASEAEASASQGEEEPALVSASDSPSSSRVSTLDDPVAGPSGIGELAHSPETIVVASPPSQCETPQSRPPSVSPEAVRPYPKAAPRPVNGPSGRKKIRACILTEDVTALELLRDKEDKKVEREEKKKEREQKKKESQKRKRMEDSDSSEEEPSNRVEAILDDSSDFSEDLGLDVEDLVYPFNDKEPEVNEYFNFLV